MATLQTSRSNKNKSPQPDFIYVHREEKRFGERCQQDKDELGGKVGGKLLYFVKILLTLITEVIFVFLYYLL